MSYTQNTGSIPYPPHPQMQTDQGEIDTAQWAELFPQQLPGEYDYTPAESPLQGQQYLFTGSGYPSSPNMLHSLPEEPSPYIPQVPSSYRPSWDWSGGVATGGMSQVPLNMGAPLCQRDYVGSSRRQTTAPLIPVSPSPRHKRSPSGSPISVQGSSPYCSPTTSFDRSPAAPGARPSSSPTSPNSPILPTDSEPKSLSHAEQHRMFKYLQQMDPNLVPQKMYRPQTSSDRRRYIDEVRFDPPIYFGRDQLHGVPLNEILNGNGQIYNGSEEVFKNCGPSISIRINWRGYEPWSKQIPTKNWKNPPGPITRQKLAKQVARRIEEFVDCMKSCEMDEEADQRWRVGSHGISVSNLTLVSLHHVSKGSWQPQLRVIR